ncbi:MAG: SRPBCC family protein [Ruegeria sp.]|uniref:SRPBCC family protein n=1 Tax=Ruegeria sp. TaxID=1879320 RepID=UPI00349F00A0
MAEVDNDRIVKTVELNAPVSRVWQALTDYEEFGQWFRVDLDQPFEVGGKSTGQITYPGHEGVPWIAYIKRMVPERLFSFMWYDADVGAAEQLTDQPRMLVEFRLMEIPKGTRLTITESGFSSLPDARRIELLRSNEEGWNIQVNNLAEHLAT